MVVRKGHEDEAFLQFFPKGFFILDETRVPMSEYYSKLEEHGAMFRVQAPGGNAARAIEQNSLDSGYLNSGDSYVIFTPGMGQCYVWNGEGANEPEINGANAAHANFVKVASKVETFKEGSESEAFWTALGGKGDYSQKKEGGMPASFEPRLFCVSNSSGYMFVKEVLNYA